MFSCCSNSNLPVRRFHRFSSCFFKLNKMTSPVVEIEQGKLQGKVCTTDSGKQYYSYKGIPYAKPPVDELRFSAPQPPEPWQGVRDATKNCNICAQFDKDSKNIVGDEDCLYLNVYTPSPPGAGTGGSALPVMVFFHGGGFIFGNGTDDAAHGPDYLVEKDVIIVSLNYRLGILGFLTLNHKNAPGNMGLKDQVQALKWVQKNIKSFGGDPKNVTIFGVSAGGASVEYLVLSPMARGLFHKAIAQSGSSLLHWAHYNKGKELAFNMSALLGNVVQDEEQLLKKLKAIPVKDLIASSMIAIAADKFRGGIHFGFVPTIETPGDWEPFLDKSPYDLLKQGNFTKVPYISGICTHEGLLLIPLGASILENLTKEKSFIEHLPFEIDDTNRTELNNRLKATYLTRNAETEEPDAFAIDFFTDVDFLGGVYVANSLISKHNSPVYFYEFAYDGSQNYLKFTRNIKRKGACHGDEGGYLIKSAVLPNNPSKIDVMVRNRMVEMWTNFAKHSDPTPETNDLIPTKWEPSGETGAACLRIDDSLTMKQDFYPERARLFEELYRLYYNKTNEPQAK